MKKVIAVHDIAGYGRVSLTTALPILSVLGSQVCPLPTAVLSNGTTGFSDFYFQDLSGSMEGMLQHWESLSLQADAVYSGFLGSPDQVDIVARCARNCLRQDGIFTVDPVMGDNGVLEPTMDMRMVARMRDLVGQATCITPNLTEAALLLGEPYPAELIDQGVPLAMLQDWLGRLCDLGPGIAVITSVPLTSILISGEAHEGKSRDMAVAAYDKWSQSCRLVPYAPLPVDYPGAGDTFASVLTGALVQGASLPAALCLAVDCILLAMEETMTAQTPPREGLALGEALNLLASARKTGLTLAGNASRSRSIRL